MTEKQTTKQTKIYDPKVAFGLAYFQAFLPKKDLSKTRLATLKKRGIDIDAIPNNVYVAKDDREYRSAPVNSIPAKRKIALIEIADGSPEMPIEEVEGFITPYGIFYTEFS